MVYGIKRGGSKLFRVHYKILKEDKNLKKNNKRGFTLAELLIVVAIIAVLTAIAIPVFTSQLEKSREATDLANVRSAYAEAVTTYLSNGGNAVEITVPAKQAVDKWQSAGDQDNTSIGVGIAVSGGSTTGSMNVPCVTSGGSYKITINASGSISCTKS